MGSEREIIRIVEMIMRKLLMLIAMLFLAGSAFASEKFTEINGVRLSIQEEGEGKAIIFIHGRGCAKEYMHNLFDYYKGKYHVFSYDTRGHGKSDKPESFTLDNDADEDITQMSANDAVILRALIGFDNFIKPAELEQVFH